MNVIKRLFCKHNWRIINEKNVWLNRDYGCIKCGKIERVRYFEDDVWRFKREMKGETFDD